MGEHFTIFCCPRFQSLWARDATGDFAPHPSAVLSTIIWIALIASSTFWKLFAKNRTRTSLQYRIDSMLALKAMLPQQLVPRLLLPLALLGLFLLQPVDFFGDRLPERFRDQVVLVEVL
jgi:hypothetical protein